MMNYNEANIVQFILNKLQFGNPQFNVILIPYKFASSITSTGQKNGKY
ncbi:hypothetical protein [Maribacter caenipelagi]|nr:hypothetical protein [Maribacter caenipelagi]